MLAEVKPGLVQELRQMLVDGATPSRLIRRLMEDDSFKASPTPALLDCYFSAAFGNKVYQMAVVDGVAFSDLRYHSLNSDVLHKMLQGLNEWRHLVGSMEGCWCEDLEAVDARVKMQAFDGKKDRYLAESWDKLDARAQSYLRHYMAVCEVAHEKVSILQKLVERLQQKLFHLEQQVKRDAPDHNVAPTVVEPRS
jgi:hypothetical protein